jgi:excisionase family DNA binding protein
MSDLSGLDEILSDLPLRRPSETISVEEAAARLGITRMQGYWAVWRNELPHIRVGRRILIPVAKLDEMLGKTSGAQPRDDEAAA